MSDPKKSESTKFKDGPSRIPALTAKKGFTIRHNEYFRVIKEGEDLADVPKTYHPNLKTEGVI